MHFYSPAVEKKHGGLSSKASPNLGVMGGICWKAMLKRVAAMLVDKLGRWVYAMILKLARISCLIEACLASWRRSQP